MNKIGFYLLSVLLIASILGCAKEEDPNPPSLPGTESFTINLTTFTEAALSKHSPQLFCDDFDTAAVLVAVWGTMTNLAFALPRLAFVVAVTQDPEYLGDLTWTWTFGAESNNIQLRGQAIDEEDSVNWEMYITNAELDHFLWYDGRCDYHATGGWWQFYKDDLPADSNHFIRLSWQKNEGDTTANLLITNNNLFSAEYGDSLSYEIDGNMGTVWLRDVDGGRPGRWNITWDINQHFGRIDYPEGAFGCWDNDLACIECDSLDWPTY
ncbi:hypothetical protein JW877_05875 [bacterium]|nr:hypothetical protein [bacterium]